MEKRIAIIGLGNLGLSIANGLMENGIVKPEHLVATKRNVTSPEIDYTYKVTSDNKTAVANADIIIVALKPYNTLSVLESLKASFRPDQLLVSLATGITLEALQSVVGISMPIFRAMPNTAAAVNESITCISFKQTDLIKNDDLLLIKSIFNATGSTIIIDENLMEAATVLGACGIAYVMRFMRAMVQGGIQIGFDAKTASAIVNQTVKGASALLLENGEHPEYEIDKVTTPKGCTIKGLNEMEHHGFSSSLIKGIVASYEKIEK